LRTNVDSIFPRKDRDEQAVTSRAESAIEHIDSNTILPTDPVPSAIELDALDLADVELREASAEPIGVEGDLELDPIPLDVGDLLGEQDDADSQIRMLRGENSFVADAESLQLQTNPMTGELTFQRPEATAENADHDSNDFETLDADSPGASEPPAERDQNAN
jgi:hypothetical protein